MTVANIFMGCGDAGARSGNATAILHEIASLVAGLLAGGNAAKIDLRGIPLTVGDRNELNETLGLGVIRATIDADGRTDIVETGCPGVWWVTHFNEAGDRLAELIEVCAVPDLLLAPDEDVAEGLEILRRRLTFGAAPVEAL